MAIQLAENLARTNPNQPIVFGSDVKGNAFPIDVLASTGSIPLGKREVGLVVFTSGSGKYYGFTGDDVANWDTPANWSEFVLSGASGTDLTGIFSGSFSGSFEGDGSGLTGVAADSATKANTVETISTTSGTEHFLTFVDSDNGSSTGEIVYTTSGISVLPGTSTIQAGIVRANSVTGSFQGDVDGTATSATQITVTQRNGNLNEHQVLFSRTTGSDQGVYGDNGFKYIPTSNGIIVGSVTASFKGDLAGTATTASYVETAQSASHVAAAFDTVSATNATITLTDMGGNNSSVTVNNVSNATTAVNATNATNATNISVDQASDDTNYNITFTESTTGNASLLVDNNGKLTYNPTTDVLTVSTLSVGGAATVGTNLTVTGDLTVNGTTTTLSTTNLDIEDAYILLRSGSGTVGSSGIIFGGSDGAAQSGSALIWDAQYNGNDGRLGITSGSTSSQTSDPEPAYYIAGVYVGSEANAATAQADHQGNIRIDGSEIYIYV